MTRKELANLLQTMRIGLKFHQGQVRILRKSIELLRRQLRRRSHDLPGTRGGTVPNGNG